MSYSNNIQHIYLLVSELIYNETWPSLHVFNDKNDLILYIVLLSGILCSCCKGVSMCTDLQNTLLFSKIMQDAKQCA